MWQQKRLSSAKTTANGIKKQSITPSCLFKRDLIKKIGSIVRCCSDNIRYIFFININPNINLFYYLILLEFIDDVII